MIALLMLPDVVDSHAGVLSIFGSNRFAIDKF